MAICFKIDATRESVASAFASNDVLMKLLARRSHEEEDEDDEMTAMEPGDDYYTAPYALVTQRMRKRKGQAAPEIACYMVFTAYKCRDAHDKAIAVMKAGIALGSFQDIQSGALGRGVKPTSVVQFRTHAWAAGDDVCLKLEDHAFVSACTKLGVDTSLDGWRGLRQVALSEMIERTDPTLASVPLAVLPEYGEVPFAPLSPEEQEMADKKRRDAEKAARDAAAQRDREFQAAKKERYARMYEKVKEAVVPPGTVCVAVFDTNTDGEEVEFRCPYDRAEGSIFCSACKAVIEKLAPSLSTESA